MKLKHEEYDPEESSNVGQPTGTADGRRGVYLILDKHVGSGLMILPVYVMPGRPTSGPPRANPNGSQFVELNYLGS